MVKKLRKKSDNSVIIVGGGWSGLATATELAKHNIPTIILESAKQLGGRARSVHRDNLYIDNGQHMMLGAYESTLDCIQRVGINESDVFERQPLALKWLCSNGSPVSINTIQLPAPLHLAWALLRGKGLSLRDRISALKFCRYLQKNDFTLDIDCNVETFLKNHKQSSEIITAIWEPLCLGALNTHIFEASAQLFLRTLEESFNYSKRDSDLLLTKIDLGSIFPKPASDYIETHNGSVRLGQKVTEIIVKDGSISGVKLSEQQINSNNVVLATPSIITNSLIEDIPGMQHVSSQLKSIRHRPICTVYLQYTENTKLDGYFCGSLNTKSQWIFDRRLYGQDGLMSVVISGEGEHMNWDNEKLSNVVIDELSAYFPDWPKPTHRHVIREKRATFAATVDINKHRPDITTPVKGLWLAGDYINNGLPSTLEGAVRSGLLCAKKIINKRQKKHK